jgi:hypothetical protein
MSNAGRRLGKAPFDVSDGCEKIVRGALWQTYDAWATLTQNLGDPPAMGDLPSTGAANTLVLVPK